MKHGDRGLHLVKRREMDVAMTGDPIAELRRLKPDLFQAPDFWRTDLQQIREAADSLKKGTASVLGRSAGGREIWAFSYGPFEQQHPTATISSALGSDCPESFYDPARRTRPVLVIVGSIHGGETEGVATCMALVRMLEGNAVVPDSVQACARAIEPLLDRVRLILVPCLNPDGRARAGVRHLCGAETDHIYLVQQGLMKDGTLFRGRRVKEIQPIPDDYLRWRGGYYNDAGVNLQHDDFFGPQVAPENRALGALFQREIPDGFLTFHAHGAPPGLTLPDAYISPGYQRKQSESSFYILSRLAARGFDVLDASTCTGPRWSFNFQVFFHHMTGALPLLCELPHGISAHPYTLDKILQSGLTVVEGWVDFALRFGLRPTSLDFYDKPPAS